MDVTAKKQRLQRALFWAKRVLLVSTVISLLFVLLVAMAFLVGWYRYNGEALARYLSTNFNRKHRGRLVIGKVEWTPSAVFDLFTGRFHRIVVTHLAIYDSEGRLAVFVPKAVGRAKIWPLIRHGDFVIDDLTADEALVVVRRYRRPDGPSRTGSEFEVGIAGAFEKPKRLWKRKHKQKHRFLLSTNALLVRRLRFELDMPHSHLLLKDARLAGSVWVRGGTKTKNPDIFFDARAQSPQGTLTLQGRRIPVRNLDIEYARSPRASPGELDAHLTAELAGTLLEARAELPGLYFGPRYINGRIHLSRFGPLLSRLTQGRIFGNQAEFQIQMLGPATNPTAHLTVSGWNAKQGRIVLSNIQGRANLTNRVITLERASCNGLDGFAEIEGSLNLDTKTWTAKARVHHVQTAKLAAAPNPSKPWFGRLDAALSARGSLQTKTTRVRVRRLVLDLRRPIAKVFSSLWAKAEFSLKGSQVFISDASLGSAAVRATVRGEVNVKNQRLKMTLDVSTSKLAALLAKWHIPVVAKVAALAGNLRGRFDNPSFDGTLKVAGVGHRQPRRGTLRADLHLSDGHLHLAALRALTYGGWGYGDARIMLYRRSLAHPVRRLPTKAWLKLQGISLARIFGPRASLSGRVSGQAKVFGPLSRLSGALVVRAPNILVRGHHYVNGTVNATLRRGDILLDYAGIEDKKGGRLRAWGTYARSGDLDVTVQAESLDIETIPGMEKSLAGKLAGRISGHLTVTGNRSWPILSGALTMARTKLLGHPVADSQLRMDPGVNQSIVTGRLFGAVGLTGALAMRPTKRVKLTFRFENLALEKILPDIQTKGQASVRLTGKADVIVGPRGMERATLTLAKLHLRLRAPSPNPMEPPRIVELANQGPVRLSMVGSVLTVKALRLAGAGGDLRIFGHVSPTGSRLSITGRLGLATLLPFLPPDTEIERLTGSATVTLAMTGPVSRLDVRGKLNLRSASVLLMGRDRAIQFPAGTLMIQTVHPYDAARRLGLSAWARTQGSQAHKLPPRGLLFTLVRLAVSLGKQTLIADGHVILSSAVPPLMKLHMSGAMSATALQVAAPQLVSNASGTIHADVWLQGSSRDHKLWGQLSVRNATLSLRGIRKRFQINKANFSFDGPRLTITKFQGKIDDGDVTAKGSILYRGGTLENVDLRVSAQNVPVRSPRVYEAELNATLHLTGDEEGLDLTGRIDVLDARYIQKFDVVRQAFLTRRTYESSKPPWEKYPLLANMNLNLSVTTSGNIFIQNNIADLRLDGNVLLGGRLAAPKFAGQIQAEEGTFRIPFLRGVYDLRNGEVDFNRGEEPYLTLAGEATVRDSAGSEHLITLTLEGFLSKVRIDLSSDTNLPKSQIIMMLASGKTTDALRQGLKGGDSGPGISSSASPLDMYDPMIKQVSGDFLSDLMAKPIKDITKLDLFRLELGTETFQLRVEKRLGRYFTLRGESEFGLMGRQRQEGALEGKLSDDIYLDVKGRRLIPGEDVFEEEDPLQGRIQLRYRLRFRGSLRRSLGF